MVKGRIGLEPRLCVQGAVMYDAKRHALRAYEEPLSRAHHEPCVTTIAEVGVSSDARRNSLKCLAYSGKKCVTGELSPCTRKFFAKVKPSVRTTSLVRHPLIDTIPGVRATALGIT